MKKNHTVSQGGNVGRNYRNTLLLIKLKEFEPPTLCLHHGKQFYPTGLKTFE